MTCIHDGILRAHLDGELGGTELAEVNQHLASCADCRARSEDLRAGMAYTGDLMATLASAGDDTAINPTVAYARFSRHFAATDEPEVSWITRLFVPRWRPAWGLAVAAMIVAIFVGVTPVRAWAQRILLMLRVEKIAVVSIDRNMLRGDNDSDSSPYRLINQLLADSVVFTLEPGNPAIVSNATQAAELAGYPIQTISSLGPPQIIEVHGETGFQMTVNRDRLEALLEGVGRSDIHIPESVNGALVAVHIPKRVLSIWGDCRRRYRYESPNTQSHSEAEGERSMERLANTESASCTSLVQIPSPTISVPPDLNMSEVAEAALELGGMTRSEAHSFCQTVDWSSTLVIPIPRGASSSEMATVDGVEGTLITFTHPQEKKYALLWIKNGVMHSLSGYGSSSDALNLAASLQ